MRQSHSFAYRLFDCPGVKLLSTAEERKLLVELADCRNRILEALHRADDANGKRRLAVKEFQQRIRDLAFPNEKNLHCTTELVRCLALRYHELRNVLAMANVRLVAHVAKRYYDRQVPPEDLIQEGFCGLLGAIDRFDIANQTRLATYAVWWIRQAIQRAVASGAYPVRLTPRQLYTLARARRLSGDPCKDQPSRSEARSQADSPIIERVRSATRPVVPLDAACRVNDPRSIGEVLVTGDEESALDDEATTSLSELIKTLRPRDQLVLKLRFGLGGESPRTLIQIGQVLGVSKERVRQIELRALTVLRTASAADALPSR